MLAGMKYNDAQLTYTLYAMEYAQGFVVIIRIILCKGPANERQHYIVTVSLIGCTHTQNDPWLFPSIICNSINFL